MQWPVPGFLQPAGSQAYKAPQPNPTVPLRRVRGPQISGFHIVITFLTVMGKIYQHSQTNFMCKAIKPLISSLALGCQLKMFQIGLRSVRVQQISLSDMPKKIWYWLAMVNLQWIWNWLGQILVLNEYFVIWSPITH
jgi:hypothetical protein